MNNSDPDDADRPTPSREDAAASAFSFALASEVDYAPGSQVGHYKLLQKIGEGGFGVVWMAEQQQPIRRRVAVKIIKIGMDTDEVIARFEAERQALALMEHPNIARVFDAGTTKGGRPFFVMELVRGVAITRYCDENRLSAEARLRLFITVCQAVQHAHQKGVIHRDLKPSNVLVTLHDGVPVPKIIDFGIAKATSAHLTDKTLFTQFHAFIGTPAYTSPEQMEMSGLDIDTRSDIYSLGVLLYELLTGQPPFDSEELMKSGLEAMRRTIREIDPPRPSTRLSTLTEINRTSIAHQRGTEAGKLSLLLRGDLDWIAMRCLEKDRTRRYESAAGLAADIERHLRDEAVEARPPGGIYQTQKFIRRHKLAVSAAAAVTASLIAGLLVSSLLFVQERSARSRAMLAEKKEGELRQQADVARSDEVRRAARTALDLANHHLAEDRIADGLAYLVYAARKNPLNSAVAPRLASVLTSANFILPEGVPIECGSRIVAMRYALDGRTFMAGTEDGTMRVFDGATGEALREFHLGKPVLVEDGWLFAKSNDSVFAAHFRDHSMAVFDASSGLQKGITIQLNPHFTWVPGRVGLSPDGRWVGAGGTTQFWLWDALTGERCLEQGFEPKLVTSFDFSADGQRVCVVAGDLLRLWTLPDCLPQVEPLPIGPAAPGSSSAPYSVRFFPDSRRVAICDPRAGVRIYDPRIPLSASPLAASARGGLRRNSWEFSPDGRMLHVGSTAEIHDLESGKSTSLPSPAFGQDWEVSFNRSGSLLLATSTIGAPRLWDAKTGKSAGEFPQDLPSNVRGIISPDGIRVVIGTAEGRIERLRIGRGRARPLKLPGISRSSGFFPDAPSRLLVLASDRARVIDVSSGRDVAGGFAFPEWTRPQQFAIREDLRFLIVHDGHSSEAWELDRGSMTKRVTLEGAPDWKWAPTFSESGDLVAISTDVIRVWNLRTGENVGPAIDGSRVFWPPSVNFSPDGRRLGVAFQGAPAIWDIATGKAASGTFQPPPNTELFSAQFNRDGTRILTADRNGHAQLWDPTTGVARSPVLSHGYALYYGFFSPNGRYFVTRSNAETRIWNAETAKPVGLPIALIPGSVLSGNLRFSSDSKRFVASFRDGIRIFDTRTAQTITEAIGPSRPFACFSPDGRFIRTESDSQNPEIWSVAPELPEGTTPPEWLLELATVCAGKVINDQGELVPVAGNAAAVTSLRGKIDALATQAPLAEWGQWILNNRPDRSIAPGFKITPAEADQIAAVLP